MDIAARLDVVEKENEMLREQIARLEKALSGDEPPPLQLGLTGREGVIFGCLMSRTFVTRENLMAALYRDFAKDEADIKIIDVFICKIRKKLKPLGIMIQTRWGQGYEIPVASKVIVRALSTEAKAAA